MSTITLHHEDKTNGFGTRLRKIRKTRYKEDPELYNYCRSTSALCDKIYASRQSGSAWETNQSYPNIDTVLKLCEALNIDPNYLFAHSSINTSQTNSLGLSSKAMARLQKKSILVHMLNFFLESDNVLQIIDSCEMLALNSYITPELLQSTFSNNLLLKLQKSFALFNTEIISLNKTAETFREYVIKQLPYDKLTSNGHKPVLLQEYIEINLEANVAKRILSKVQSNTDSKTLYDEFINEIADVSLPLLMDKFHQEYLLHQITLISSKLLNDFFLNNQLFLNSTSVINNKNVND